MKVSDMRRIAFLATLAFAAPAGAADFYQGKSVAMLVNFTAGGPTDVEARLVARHLGKHVPGAPAIVVRNMGGAGGAIGANWLGEIAPPDGLNIGYLTGAASKAAIGENSLRVDVTKMAFVAGVPGVSVAYIRTDVPPGMKTPADIMKARDFWAGGLSAESDKDIRERMQLDLLGIPHKYITGYPGSAEARLALQRNELQMYPESMPTYRATIESGMVKEGEAIPLWHDPLDDGEKFTASPDAEGIPAKTFTDFLIEQKGALPKGELFDAFRVINSVGTVFLRVLLMPPNAPKEHVAAMKAALVAMVKDGAYREDALRTMKFVPTFLVDDRTERNFRDKLNPDPKIRAFIQAYVEKGKALAGKK
jgi:hypothetical protein